MQPLFAMADGVAAAEKEPRFASDFNDSVNPQSTYRNSFAFSSTWQKSTSAC